jgi:hypothetical protein
VKVEIIIEDPSVIAYSLLGIASLVLVLARLRDVVGGRGQAFFVLDLVVACVALFTAGRFSDLVATLAFDGVLFVVAVSLAAGLAGMAITGLVALLMVAIDGNGTPVIAWFVTPLLVGAALRNIRLAPQMPPRVSGALPVHIERWFMRPAAGDVLWGLAARLVCVVPLVFVFLVPGDADLKMRVAGAVMMWVMLLTVDRARRPLLITHRRAARTTDVGLFLVLLAVAAGPDGELISRWWVAHLSESRWYVALPPVVIILNAAMRPQFDRWRVSWLVVWARRTLVGLEQIVLICTTLPFLIAGVFHPAQGPLAIAFVALLPGFMHVGLSAWNGDGFNRQIADAWVLVRATPPERKMLLTGWRNDNFHRHRTVRVRTWDYTNLPRIAGMLAQLGAESAHATTAVHMTLPWGESVRLDHTFTQKFLRLAEQALDEVDSTFPTEMSTPGTIGHHVQQIARADLAVRRSTVAQYLDDFESAITAARQAADHYTAASAPAHAATEIILTANRLSAVRHHDAAAELLAEVPDDLPPPIRRLLLVVRAAVAQRAGRDAAASSLLAAARAIPDRSTIAFRKAFLVERVKFPAYAEGAHNALVATERELIASRGSH